MSIGENIKQTRKILGLKQKDLAERLGVTPPTVAMYENDKTNIRYETLIKIAKALGVSPASLLDPGENLFSTEQTDVQSICGSSSNFGLLDMSDDDLKTVLNEQYDRLNRNGKIKAVEFTADLTEIDRYKK